MQRESRPTISNFYRLRVVRPLNEEIDPGTQAEISESAEPHDYTLDAQIGRWMGGVLSEAEAMISEWLPEGWYVKIEARP